MTPRVAKEGSASTATPLSRRARRLIGKRPGFGLAQQSLVAVLSMTVVSSCIVADPPTYTDPTQTRPALNAYSATPQVFQVLVIQLPTTTAPSFTVPVRSEDNGEGLNANLIVDYGSTNAFRAASTRVAPASFNDDTDRFITLTWAAVNQAAPGCHTVTLIVAHESTFPNDFDTLDPLLASKDAALLTWWLNLLPDSTKQQMTTTVVGCPSQQPTAMTPASQQ